MIKTAIRKAVGLTAAAAAATAGTAVMTTTEAHAAGDGRVIARPSLNARYAPTTKSIVRGSLDHGNIVPLSCKVTGTNVDGNRRWYLLPGDGGPEWISARYVDNVGRVPGWCANDERFVGRAITAVNIRRGPNTRDARVRTLARGAGVDIVCKVWGQNIDGNRKWYWTEGGNWVSARYISNVGRAPHWCVEF